jgi:hypothetical protein
MALAPCALRPLTGVGGGMRLALASLLLGSPACSIASDTCMFEDIIKITDARRLQDASCRALTWTAIFTCSNAGHVDRAP